MKTKICLQCQTPLINKKSTAKFCDKKCKDDFHNHRKTVTQTDGRKFQTQQTALRQNYRNPKFAASLLEIDERLKIYLNEKIVLRIAFALCFIALIGTLSLGHHKTVSLVRYNDNLHQKQTDILKTVDRVRNQKHLTAYGALKEKYPHEIKKYEQRKKEEVRRAKAKRSRKGKEKK
ncbi:hypothetical protein [Persicobacter psychrovividus]|uniref:DUF2116 family Zn-ribbon domain-containing protein n=1 Tax=Persicobacter psychrovividus TaxID=387638 RepID=A0ABN6LLR2_9BACT|nr:hypothetical protein PEPS_46620 [Persicobacter psychrovividus]